MAGLSKELHDLVDKDNESCCLYSLANKCKEWAYTKDYHLDAEYTDDFWSCCCVSKVYCGCAYETIYHYSEPEAIFEATEWVMKQKGRDCNEV